MLKEKRKKMIRQQPALNLQISIRDSSYESSSNFFRSQKKHAQKKKIKIEKNPLPFLKAFFEIHWKREKNWFKY